MLSRIRHLSAQRPSGTIEAGMIGSPGTCATLTEKGYITIELHRIGSLGGHYYRYRPSGQADGLSGA